MLCVPPMSLCLLDQVDLLKVTQAYLLWAACRDVACGPSQDCCQLDETPSKLPLEWHLVLGHYDAPLCTPIRVAGVAVNAQEGCCLDHWVVGSKSSLHGCNTFCYKTLTFLAKCSFPLCLFCASEHQENCHPPPRCWSDKE